MTQSAQVTPGAARLWAAACLGAALAGWGLWALPARCCGGDWPQWGYDAGRGAASADELPDGLHLQWTRQLPEPLPAWPASQPELRFDVSYSPVAAGNLLIVPSMVSDRVTAYDAETGAERWRFYADGPVRFAPLVDQGKVFFVSDDGYLYCLDAERGTLCWKFRGGPYDRKLLGNERLVSTWPARGGPVLHEGVIYFTAGIWPFMGIFVHAVDAASGRAVWTNSGEGSTFMSQPHVSPAFGGFAPSGYLAATAEGLIVPGGRTQPACYDLKTGQLRYFDFGTEPDRQGKPGTFQVCARDRWCVHNGQMYAVADGKPLLATPGTVCDGQTLYGVDRDDIVAQTLQPVKAAPQQPAADPPAADPPAAQKKAGKAAKGKKGPSGGAKGGAGGQQTLTQVWRASLADGLPKRLFLKAGSRLILGGTGVVAAVAIPTQGGPVQAAWQGTFAGEPWSMLAADGRLFVVTTAGSVYCFGARSGEPKTYAAETSKAVETVDAGAPAAGPAGAGVKEGYGVLFGLSRPELAEGLLRNGSLRLIAIDPDAQKVDAARRRLDALGLYGLRFSAHVGDVLNFSLPPYLANLAVVAAPAAADPQQGPQLVQAVFQVLRPYGGVAIFESVAADVLRQWAKQADLAGAQVEEGPGGSRLVRAGALPGAADWTHQYADAANSVVSQDRLAKAPLGLLWFGGPSDDEVLPRHGHGPSPQVAGGRLVIEGPDMLRALDVYTGRLLWQTTFPSLGKFYDSTEHQPGADEIGSNYVTLPDRVYVVRGSAVLELDAATGQQKQQFAPAPGADGAAPNVGFLAVWEDFLVATAMPVKLGAASGAKGTSQGAAPSAGADPFAAVPYASTSHRLVVFDRHSGKILWQREAQCGFRHNAIAVGANRVFCIDGMSQAMLAVWKRRGVDLAAGYQPRLLALDVQTGRELWSTNQDVFGTFLSYSTEHDVLLQDGSASRDRAKDEAAAGMAAYRGADGTVLWKDLQREYNGPCMLHHDSIITQSEAFALLTGQPKFRKDPLTGREILWGFQRNYGCNTAVASEHLLTFRSAAAGYYDLARDGGTGNFGGFKSGCTSNLIVADGVLNAPEYTRTCTCHYQNQTSLAMVYDPQVEAWTFNAMHWKGEAVRRLGINLGAPGDRMADDGTLWLDYPSQGGPSPDVPLELKPEKPAYFRYHSAQIKVQPGTRGLSWVAASGVRNISTLTLTLSQEKSPLPRKYTVRLHFAEVEPVAPGQRVFRVRLQDQPAGPDIDIVKEAGPMTALVKEFRGVAVADKLTVAFEPSAAGSLPAVLCGIEVAAEDW